MRQHSIKWTENLLLSATVNALQINVIVRSHSHTQTQTHTHQNPNDLFGFSFSSQCVNHSITPLHVSFGFQCAQLTNGKQNKRNKITQFLCECVGVDVFLLIRLYFEMLRWMHRDNRKIMETYKKEPYTASASASCFLAGMYNIF